MGTELRRSTGGKSGSDLYRGRVRSDRGIRRPPASLLFACATLFTAPALAATFPDFQPDAPDAPDDSATDPRTVHASPDPARFLPGAVAAAAGSPRAAGIGWGGYDAATHDPLLGATVEARLGTRLVIGAGVTYAAATSLQPWAARPSVVARVQILDQRSHGIDAGVAFGFRQDRFVEEDGFLQASVAGGWRSERTTLLGNLGYGQDGEGDDHEGELRLAGLYRVQGALHLGLDGRVRKLLNSTDPRLALHGTPSLEFTAGPVAALTLGPWALLVETGISGVRRGTLHTGAIVVGGVGATF